MVQWLRLCTSNAGDKGSIPGQGTKILHAAKPKKEKNQLSKIKYSLHPTHCIILSHPFVFLSYLYS